MFDALTTNATIHSEKDLRTLPFYLVSAGNGKFVTTFGSNSSALHAFSNRTILEALFQFVPVATGEVRIFSLYHRAFVSAIGAGRPLFPRVEDESWSRFNLMLNADGTICMTSTQPIARGGPYVSVIGESRILRISEKTARQPWSFFIPYAANAPVAQLSNFIDKNKYVAEKESLNYGSSKPHTLTA